MARRCIKCKMRSAFSMMKRGRWRYVFSSMGSVHQHKHSKVVDACVDVDIFDAVEYINTNICPTKFSCQGYKDYPAGVTVSIKYWQTFRQWMEDNGYTIGYAYDYFYEKEGWGIKRPAGFDFDVWVINKSDVVNINFPKGYQEIFKSNVD